MAGAAKQPDRAGALLERWLERKRVDLRPHELALRWAELVSERIAARSDPVALDDGVLTVQVADSTWLHELSFLREHLVAQINERVGAPMVRAIKLVPGRVPRRRRALPPPPEPTAPSSDDRARAAIQADADIPAGTDDELRQRIVRARQSQIAHDISPKR